jgi:hypothetical protein
MLIFLGINKKKSNPKVAHLHFFISTIHFLELISQTGAQHTLLTKAKVTETAELGASELYANKCGVPVDMYLTLTVVDIVVLFRAQGGT